MTAVSRPTLTRGRAAQEPDTALGTTATAKRRASKRSLLFAIAAVILAGMFLFPIVWAVLSSVKSPAEAAAVPPTILPQDLSAENFTAIRDVGQSGLWIALRNSLITTSITVVLTIVVTTLSGYAFSRSKFRFKTALFILVLLPIMIPFQSIVIPLFQVQEWLGIRGTLIGLALIYVTFQIPFSTYVMRTSFESIPIELEDAARVDGAGSWQILRRVMVPIVVPGIITVGLFAFLMAWNEFLAALVMISDQSKFTVPILLSLIQANQYGAVDWGALQAGVVAAMLPSLLVFLLLQRYYDVGAMTAGSLKG